MVNLFNERRFYEQENRMRSLFTFIIGLFVGLGVMMYLTSGSRCGTMRLLWRWLKTRATGVRDKLWTAADLEVGAWRQERTGKEVDRFSSGMLEGSPSGRETKAFP